MSDVGSRPVLVIHGGAGSIPDDAVEARIAGIRAALDAGWGLLEGGGSALDVVEAAIVSMEADGSFDAGRGSVLNQDGRVQLDAMIMDGSTLAAGAVAGVETVWHPISVARAVMEQSAQVYFVGRGAERFALEHGFAAVDNAELVSPRERRRFEAARALVAAGEPAQASGDGDRATLHGTVGAVALDLRGNLAAGTSTGGIDDKPVGRVGDSSVVGAGGYADNESAAVSCTGEGEAIMRLVLGKWAVDRVGDGLSPQQAANAAIERLAARLGGQGGLILLDPAGRTGIAFNTPRMAWGIRTSSSLDLSVG